MIALETLARALSLPHFDVDSAHARMAPLQRRLLPPEGANPRQAGVLVLLYPDADDWHITLTRRTEDLRSHSGQISFPGGRRDPHDASFTATALRETCEELGMCQPTQIIGMLSTLYIPPSNYEVYPTVAALSERPVFTLNPDEVAEVFSLSFTELLDDRIKACEDREFSGMTFSVPYYAVQGHKVWGATAIMLSELEHRLRAALAP